MEFKKSVIPPENISSTGYYFIYNGNSIFVKIEKDRIKIPLLDIDDANGLELKDPYFIGELGDHPCYSVHAPDDFGDKGFKPVNIRSLIDGVESCFWHAAGYARQIHDWNLNFTFCGRCGARNEHQTDEHARICPECRLTSYPRISPAVIIAVIKDDKILLARGINFPNKKMFSVLAGFVDPDETLEQCVSREVFEETGVNVKDIRYFGSQPWPFPDSLMIGFTAVYDSGKLNIDTDELAEANWFSFDNLPLIPDSYTIARQLIDWFVETRSVRT